MTAPHAQKHNEPICSEVERDEPSGAILELLKAAGREYRLQGSEYVTRCVQPERHKNGDAHPSLRVNADKNVAHCPVCNWGGGLRKLAVALGHGGRVDGRTDPSDEVSPSTRDSSAAWTDGLTEPGEESVRPSAATERTDGLTVTPGSVRPSAQESWEQCALPTTAHPSYSYLSQRHLEQAIGTGEVRKAAGGQIAVPLRDLAGQIRDLQFRSTDPAVDHRHRFTRLLSAAKDAGPVIFGTVGSEVEILITEGMTDYLSAIGPLGFSSGQVIGIPGTGTAEKTMRELHPRLPSGAVVAVAFDADQPGEDAAEKATEILTDEGFTVRRLRPPKPHKDLAEWTAAIVEAGGQPGAEIRKAINEAPLKHPFPWSMSATDFVTATPTDIPFLLKPYLPVGALVVIHGPPETGKTWFILYVARQVTALGRNVMLVEEEGAASGLSQRLKLLDAANNKLQIAHRGGIRLDDDAWLKRLERQCKIQKIDLLILDPLAELHEGDENSTADMGKVVQALKRLRQNVPDLTVIVLHHTVKGSWSEPKGKKQHARGSSAITGAADVQLALSPLQWMGLETPAVSFRLDVVKVRDFATPPPARAALYIDNDKARLEITPMDSTSSGDDDLEANVFALIPDSTTQAFATVNHLRKRLNVGKEKIDNIIARLIAEGRVVRIKNKGLQRVPGSESPASDTQPGGDVAA